MKKYDTTTKITNFNVNWQAIKSACMTTISKQAGDKEPSKEWKRKLLICRHSPIRRGIISWKWENIPYAISTHFARHHEGCEKFIGTERTDRTNVDREQRSQMNYVPMEMDANIQALMSIAERRLCMCADPTTREYMEALVEEIRKYDEDIAWSLVPQCVRCGGCVEPFGNCQYYDSIYDRIPEEARDTVMKRYDIYDKQRVRKLELKRGK
jgi:hypothetical protein